jgi:hypothetical protein
VTKSLKSFPGVTVREGMKREDVREREKVEDHDSKGLTTRQEI